jgi:hemolysin III
MTDAVRRARVLARRYTLGEEIANCASHALGLGLAIAGVVVLAVFATHHGDAWHVVGCSVFGATLVLLYAASTLYHGVRDPRLKAALRLVDHASIFLLIAGTYTPITLVNLRGPWGWSLLAAIWLLAVVGIVLRVAVRDVPRSVMVGLYIGMGWAAIVASDPMLSHVAAGGLVLLLCGGIAYTAGVGFYLWRRLPYHHAIWHFFVLAGSVLHFFAVLFYVVPLAGGTAG